MERIPVERFCRKVQENEVFEDFDEDEDLELVQERGSASCKVITLNAKMVDLDFEFTDDSKVYLSIEEKNLNFVCQPRHTKILWINAAQPIDEAKLNFTDYVKMMLEAEDPHIFIMTSSSNAYPAHVVSQDLTDIEGRPNFFGKVGRNGAGFCVGTNIGVIAGKGKLANGHMQFTYGHNM